MIILIDQDGVLSDYNATMYEHWEAAHPKEFEQCHIPLEQVTDHDLKRLYPAAIQAHLKKIENAAGFFQNMNPIPGAVDAVRELQDMGHDICICTRPAKKVYEQCVLDKFKWAAQHLGPEFIEHMMVVRDKTFAYGDVLIDDRPTIEGALTPSWEHVLYDQPYNRAVQGQRRLSWEGNWKEVLHELQES